MGSVGDREVEVKEVALAVGPGRLTRRTEAEVSRFEERKVSQRLAGLQEEQPGGSGRPGAWSVELESDCGRWAAGEFDRVSEGRCVSLESGGGAVES